METLYAGQKDLSDPEIRKQIVKNIIAETSFININVRGVQRKLYNNPSVRRKAEDLLDLYILRKKRINQSNF